MQSLWDPGLFKGDLRFGPFANESDFDDFLRFGLQRGYEILDMDTWIDREERDEIDMMVTLQNNLEHKIVFTHGDANCANILVRDGKIVGLVDFEFAGFYPEYWEYTNAMNIGPAATFWKKEIGKFLEPWPRELEMENIRRKHFGPRGY
jgi:Ser/Thr protein kinase RdoA (MazF antagonist)